MSEKILKAVKSAEITASINPLEWTEGFKLSAEQAEMISDPEWVYENLIILGHVVAIAAEPNGGKTTLLMHVAGEIAKRDYSVFYVNADIAGGEAKQLREVAELRGINLLLPDLAGKSMSEIVSQLYRMNKPGANYSGQVFIFDTLKKMTDVINKSQSKELYTLLRSLSAKGLTIVLLAHTNKYKDSEGSPVYEGTGDLRSDVDELIYLIPERFPDKSMIVSTKPDKVRGAFNPISFRIDKDRQVRQMESFHDTAQANLDKQQREKDASAIEFITAAIEEGKAKQTEILQYCRDNGIGRRQAEAVLKRYRVGNLDGMTALWERQKAFEKNAWNYQLIEMTSAATSKASQRENNEKRKSSEE